MSEKSISASRVIDAPAEAIFEVLTLPSRHVELDASGTVISGTDQRIQAVGDVFTMNMHADVMGGDYTMDNHVTGFDANKLVAWKPCPQGQSVEKNGWEWQWRLEPEGPEATRVTETYSWEHVHPKLLEKMHFPVFPVSVLEHSLERLAAAVSQD